MSKLLTVDREASWAVGEYVFISCAMKTDPASDIFANELSAKLETKSVHVFSGKAPTGGLHVKHFERGARTSRVFVAILTDEYFRRLFTMHELDLALAARDLSRGRTMVIPIVMAKSGLQKFALKSSDFIEGWRKIAQENALGTTMKVDLERWQHCVAMLNEISWEVCKDTESKEAFLDRCVEAIARAMAQDPFDREHDVFVAHAGEQKDFAVQLRDVLRQLGFRAFVDQLDLPPGFGDADGRIGKALQDAHVGVAILSRAFFEKKAPMRELELIAEQDNLLPILWDVTYEEMVELCQGSRLLEQDGFKRKVIRTTAFLGVESKEFRSVLCQKVAFAVLRRIASRFCLETIQTQAAYHYVERLRHVLRRAVSEDDCMPDILKKDVTEAACILRQVEATLGTLREALFSRL